MLKRRQEKLLNNSLNIDLWLAKSNISYLRTGSTGKVLEYEKNLHYLQDEKVLNM